MSGPITLRAQTARRELQVCNDQQLVYLLITAQTAPVAVQKLPLNLCFVVDRSSSMRGERLFQVKEAARHVIGHLDSHHAFGLVAFNDRAEVIVPSQLVREPDTMKTTIAGLEARGGTEMAQGLALGLQEIDRPRINGLNRLILLTDGRTYGDEHACVELARRAQRRGIGLTTLGLGTEWNEDLLETMTAGPNSRTQYLASSNEIVPVFTAELDRLNKTIAQSVEFSFSMHPDAQIRNIHRVQPFLAPLAANNAGNGVWRVPLGEWTGGENQTFLLEIVVPPVTAGTYPIARIDLRYDLIGAAGSQAVATTGAQLPAVARADRAVDTAVRTELERVVAYQLQTRAWQSVAEGRIAEATKCLQMAGTHLFNAGAVALAETVHAEATRLLQSGNASADGRKRIKYGTRGLVAGA